MLRIEKRQQFNLPDEHSLYMQSNSKNFRLRKGRFFILLLLFLFIFVSLFTLDKLNASSVLNFTASNSSNNTLNEKISNVIESGAKAFDFIQETAPQLKSNSGLTSILLVGVDTRNVKLANGEFISTKPLYQAGTRNTDTILQLVYNSFENKFVMISIPRDMGVDVNKNCLTFHGSLHWVYDKGQRSSCPGGGIEVLKETVTNITGIPIHYHVFVTLDAFKDVINIVGETNSNGQTGIYIDNPKAFYEVYPINDSGWENLYFPAGRQFMDADRALKFVRSRKFTSDFGRARRQQIFIEALQDRLLSMDIIFNPSKVLGILDTLRTKVIFSEPESIGEIRAVLDLVRQTASEKMTHIVLDPEFGGHEVLLDKQPHTRRGPYYMVPTAWQECPGNEFCKVKERILNIVRNPESYQQ